MFRYSCSCPFFHRITTTIFAGLVLCLLSLDTYAQDAFPRGVELYNQGRYDQAETVLMEALQSAPRSADIYYYLGLIATHKGEQARAVAAYKRAAKLNPELDGVQLSMGIAYYKMDLDELAINSFKRAAKQDPGDASAPFFLGLSLEESGKYHEAVQWFQKAATLDPGYEQLAYYNIGMAQAKTGNTSAAKQSLRRAITADPSSDTGRDAQNFLASMEGGEEAAAPSKRWFLSANAGIEYDDNVTVSEVDNTTGLEDIAAVFDLSAAYQIYKTGGSEIELGYDFYQSVFDDLSNFDLQSHLLSVIASSEFGSVDGTFSYSYNYLKLGGDSFLKIHSIMPSVGFSFIDNMYHSLSYNYKDKEFTNNTARNADDNAAGLDNYYFFRDGHSYGYLNLRLEDENTLDPQFDYTGYYVTAGAKSVLPVFVINPEIHVSYQYYRKDYSHITTSIADQREDERSTVTLSIEKQFSEIFNIKLNYQYIDADSNLSSSDFTENVFTVTLGAGF